MEYSVAARTEKEEVVEFINKVFSRSDNRDTDFTRLIKKVYGKEAEFNHRHHLVKEDGRIAAVIGVYQREYHIMDTVLKTGFIGSVSVDADMRGRGYMKLLMKKAEEDMRSQGISLAMLAGSRNRYGYFGYEVGGLRNEFVFAKSNITHTIGWMSEGQLELEPVCAKDKIDDEIYRLYESYGVHGCSRDEFLDRAMTWQSSLYAVKQEDKYLGYVILSEDGGRVNEIELSDWSYLLEVVREVMLIGDKERISVYSLAWENEKNIVLQKQCETHIVLPACSYKILDYVQTLKALFELQLSYRHYIAEDVFTIGVKGQGCYRIEILGKKVTVTEEPFEDESFENADIVVTDIEFVSAFMSSASYMYESRAKKAYPAGWFPLGFAPPIADEF